MNSVLITGYSGFVGSLLCKDLKTIYKLRLLGRKDSDSGVVFKSNIDASSNFSEALNGVKCVIHSAARVHVMNDTSNNPLIEFKTVNTFGTIHLARQAAQAGVKRFIFVSSIKVNGETTTGKQSFTSKDERMPKDPYGISKSDAEAVSYTHLTLPTNREV